MKPRLGVFVFCVSSFWKKVHGMSNRCNFVRTLLGSGSSGVFSIWIDLGRVQNVLAHIILSEKSLEWSYAGLGS
jgi:hypothetical protein